MFYLTNKEAYALYYTVIKHDAYSWLVLLYISRVLSNVGSILSQCNTQLRLLHLLYDIDFTPRVETTKHIARQTVVI